MNRHVCARIGTERVAVSVCRFCSIALCKDHLVASFCCDTVPQYACYHHPERPFAPLGDEARTKPGSIAGRPA